MNVLELIKVIIYGIIEGITEWLPISSTGHLILAEEVMKMNVSKQFMEMFRVVIQLGAIMAVVVLYFQKLNPFSKRKNPSKKRETIQIWMKVIIGCAPAGIIGVLFDDVLDRWFYNFQTVAIALIVYGVLFIIIENRNHKRRRRPAIESFDEMSYGTALLIGLFQVLAIIPGTSRSGSTILGAMLVGTSRHIAAEFSFFMAIPVMFGASGLKILKYGFAFTGTEIIMLVVGMLVAFVVSIIAIKFLMGYIKNNDFKAFGYYRIILGLILIGYYVMFK